MKKLLLLIATLFALGLNAQTKPKNNGYAVVERGYRWETSPCGATAKQMYLNWEATGTWDIPAGVNVEWITDETLQFIDYADHNLNYMEINPKFNGSMPLIWCPDEWNPFTQAKGAYIYPECANRIKHIKKHTFIQAAQTTPVVTSTPTQVATTPTPTQTIGNMGLPPITNTSGSTWTGTTTQSTSTSDNTISEEAFDWDAFNKRKAGKIVGWTAFGLGMGSLATWGGFKIANKVKANRAGSGTQTLNYDWAFNSDGDTDGGFGGNDPGTGDPGDTDGTFGGGKKSMDVAPKTFSSSRGVTLATVDAPVNYQGNLAIPTPIVGATATFSIGGNSGLKFKKVTLDF